MSGYLTESLDLIRVLESKIRAAREAEKPTSTIIEDLTSRLEESERKNRTRQENNFGLHRRNVRLQGALDLIAERIPQLGIGVFPLVQEEDLETLLRREIQDIIRRAQE